MRENIVFPITMGLTDGVITVLMLASADFLGPSVMTVDLALRIAFGSAFVGTLSFFIAEYSRLRFQLIRASRQLTMHSPESLIRSDLGAKIFMESLAGTLLSGTFGFVGALIPLSVDVIDPAFGLVAILSAYFVLAAMGLAIGNISSGNKYKWMAALILLGLIVTTVGNFVSIIH